MCNEIMRIESRPLEFIPDCFKTQDICDKAVRKCSSSLMHVSDWFVTREWIYMWYDDIEYCDDEEEYNFFK